jgi:hypothetical protein
MEAESFPPCAGGSIERGDDDSAARCGLVEIDGGREGVCGERGPDPETRVATVDGEPAEQQCGHRIGRALAEHLGSGRAIDPGHRDACVGDDHVLDVCDGPGSCGVSALARPALAGGPSATRTLAAAGFRAARWPSATVRKPPCTKAAIVAGLHRYKDNGRTIGYGCHGRFAYAYVIVPLEHTHVEITVLLRSDSRGWEVVSRAKYCNNGVPAQIRQQACGTN